MKRQWAAWLSVVALAGTPTVAHAQASKEDSAQAQHLFDEARVLMDAHRYTDACPKLEQSQRLDPGMGTQFRLAECQEGAGKLATAWTLFTEVADAANKAGRGDRETQVRQRADALKPRVPTMTITIAEAIWSQPGLEVTRDGAVIGHVDWNRRVPIDPGSHTVTATAPGKKPWQRVVVVVEGGSVDIPIAALEPALAPSPQPISPPVKPPLPDAPPQAPPDSAPTTGSGSGRRIAAVVTGAVGLAGIGVGAALGVMAKSKWDSALQGCQGGAMNKCDAAAIDHGNGAAGLATISTVGFIVGGAALAAGTILWFTAPSKKSAPPAAFRFVPAVGRDGAIGTLQGSF